jgi:hypothetical protein
MLLFVITGATDRVVSALPSHQMRISSNPRSTESCTIQASAFDKVYDGRPTVNAVPARRSAEAPPGSVRIRM